MKAMSPAREAAAPAMAPSPGEGLVAPTAPQATAPATTTDATPPPAAGLAPTPPPITAPVPTPEKGVAVDQTTTISAVTSDRRAQLRAKIAEDAFDNLARLRELLKTAPESTKPALMQAIAVAEEGYTKALEALN